LLASAFFSVASDFLLACSEPRCSDTVTVTASLLWESYVCDSKNAPPNTTEGGIEICECTCCPVTFALTPPGERIEAHAGRKPGTSARPSRAICPY
jgi:hypothetical protein